MILYRIRVPIITDTVVMKEYHYETFPSMEKIIATMDVDGVNAFLNLIDKWPKECTKKHLIRTKGNKHNSYFYISVEPIKVNLY
jgi:hypothetical protein